MSESKKDYGILYRLGKAFSLNYRGFIVAALAEIFALVYHISFLLFFYKANVLPMFYFNIFSVVCFVVCLFILFRLKNVNLVFLITTFEVILHQILADYFLGGLSGFHFLIMILVVFPFLVEKKTFNIGIPFALLSILIFFACEIYFSNSTPVYLLPDSTLKTIRIVNIVCSMTVVLTMIVIFKLIINYIEENLEILNEKNENLLENILPKKVVENLRETGHTEPEMFNNVSVLFTDIVDFTRLSKELSPEILIEELNEIFTAFDKIMDKYNCVRIKTIGDAYMAVCGVPVPDDKHACNIMNAALECRDYLKERNLRSEHKWTIRLGVHTGPVVAGIVGVKKYIYDVFGDAVNVASRMESNSKEMKLCVSKDIYNLTKDDFIFQSEGEKNIKGKGNMEVFFVEKNS